MKTTLNKIRDHEPCINGWKKLLQSLGKTQADDEPLSLITILDSNGLDDALWCLRAVDGHKKEMRLYAVWCARQVQHLMTDQRSLDALDVAELFANGEATKDELNAARDVAWTAMAAASDATRTAMAAASDAAWAAKAAASDAAWAAMAAASDAAWAAKAAASDAAWAARAAARDARDAARAAASDASAAVRNAQETKFREIFGEQEP